MSRQCQICGEVSERGGGVNPLNVRGRTAPDWELGSRWRKGAVLSDTRANKCHIRSYFTHPRVPLTALYTHGKVQRGKIDRQDNRLPRHVGIYNLGNDRRTFILAYLWSTLLRMVANAWCATLV